LGKDFGKTGQRAGFSLNPWTKPGLRVIFLLIGMEESDG